MSKHIVEEAENNIVIRTADAVRDIRYLIDKSMPKEGEVVDHYTPIDRVTIYSETDNRTISVVLSSHDIHKLILAVQRIEKPFKQVFQDLAF